MFNALTGTSITAPQAAMFMILVKLDRENHNPKRDNRVDGAGYFGVLDMIRQKEDDGEDEIIVGDKKIVCGNPYWGVYPTPEYIAAQTKKNHEMRDMLDKILSDSVGEKKS